MSDSQFSRRSFLTKAAILGTSAVVPSLSGSVEAVTPNNRIGINGDLVVATEQTSLAETTSGKIRGFKRDGIHIFRGVPYGASTAGAKRFLPPEKPEPWAGIRSALYYGQVCPFPPRANRNNDEEAFIQQWNDGQPGEDCLRANIWTPGIGDHGNRPVMVWLHGGAFAWGSGQELKSYDGENLCRRGDVVVVTLNHRLNAFGFLNLAEFGGERYASSGNIGMLDLVLALEWVRDNICSFGGNPRSVMIFGQSGGGGKVGTLMAMPLARGLFHRAAIQSGSMLRVAEMETTYRMTHAVLAELNISGNELSSLHTVPSEQLIAAAQAAERKLIPNPADPPDFRHLMKQLAWAPVVDGKIIPSQPFDPHAPAYSADIPLIVGTTLNEFVNGINAPNAFSMTQEQLFDKLTTIYGSNVGGIISAYQHDYPHANPYQLYSIVMASSVRSVAVEQARRQTALRRAPVYLYQFTWQTPILDGRPMAFHCSDLAFCWDNVSLCDTMTGDGPEAHALAATMSDAWIHFARTGSPNHHGLPHWPAFETATVPTMIFDDRCVTENDPDGTGRNLMDSLAAAKR